MSGPTVVTFVSFVCTMKQLRTPADAGTASVEYEMVTTHGCAKVNVPLKAWETTAVELRLSAAVDVWNGTSTLVPRAATFTVALLVHASAKA